jgi:hypothetical protein
LNYESYSDFGGYTVVGIHSTKTTTSADGYNFGELAFAFSADASIAPYLGKIKYGNDDGSDAVQIRGGVTIGGSYRVTFDDGSAFDVPFNSPTRLIDCLTSTP